MKKWDFYERECAFDHGWHFDRDETLVLTAKQYEEYQYSGTSIKNPNVRTLMIPSINGSCLIFEGKHFRIEG